MILSVTRKRGYLSFLGIYMLTIPNTTVKIIGLTTLVGQVAGGLFEIPSGMISDRIGHKNAIVLAYILTALSSILYLVAFKPIFFFVAAIFSTTAMALLSGTENAFLHDTLRYLGKDDDYAQIFGQIKAVGTLFSIALVLGLPLLTHLGFRWAFLAMLLIDIVGIIAALGMTNPTAKIKKITKVASTSFTQTFNTWRKIGWAPYIIIASLGFGISAGAMVGFNSIYQEILGFSVPFLGVLWAISRLTETALHKASGWIYHRISFKMIILIQTSIYTISFIVIYFFLNKWIVAILFMLCLNARWGLAAVTSHHKMNFLKNTEDSATLLSINGFIVNFIVGISGLIMGYLVASAGYAQAYLFMGFGLMVVFIIGIALLPKYTPSEKNTVRN